MHSIVALLDCCSYCIRGKKGVLAIAGHLYFTKLADYLLQQLLPAIHGWWLLKQLQNRKAV